MTLEERFARIEHVTAGMAEQREKDREEYKALWRDTQRQIDAFATTTHQLADTVAQMAAENRAEHERRRQADAELNARQRQSGAELDARVAALVSAIGQFIANQPPRQ
jgi:septal ring factor EnvC (AmiA/AmiB activator)